MANKIKTLGFIASVWFLRQPLKRGNFAWRKYARQRPYIKFRNYSA